MSDNLKIMCVGDLHLNSSTPRSRIDDYSQTTLNKLNSLRIIAESEAVNLIIFTGDIFHKNNQPMSYVNKVIQHLKKFPSEIRLLTICGNHDLAYDRLDYLDRSPLGNLIYSGVLERLDATAYTLNSESISIRGFDVSEPLEPAASKPYVNIAVAHRFYNYNLAEEYNLTKNDIAEMDYDIYILGHDHIKYNPVKVSGSLILRPGSLLRATSHNYNINRAVSVDILKFKSHGGDTPIKLDIARREVDHLPASKVFSPSVLDSDGEQSFDIDDITKRIEGFISEMGTVGKDISVYSVLDGMEIDEDVRDRIEYYLEQSGIYRKEC